MSERYIIKRPQLKLGEVGIGHTEYRYRGDTTRVAFTETTFKLATDNNNPSVARSMVDVAEAHDWRRLAERLGLARPDPQAIDEALARRLPQEEPFTRRAARLEAAAKPADILAAAQSLDDLNAKLSQGQS